MAPFYDGIADLKGNIIMKKLGFGLMRLPVKENADNSTIDIDRLYGLVDEFIAEGFTYFDTAMPYHSGASEAAFREAVVKRYPRDAYTVTDKLSLFKIDKKEDIPAFFDKQLQDLGVDCIDIYLLHAVDEEIYAQALEWDAIEFMKQKKRDGKVKHIGFSFHDSPEVLDKVLTEHPEFEYVQLQINYLDWEDKAVQSRSCLAVAIKHGKPVIVMEPIKGGSLVNISDNIKNYLQNGDKSHSVASWAIRFAASQKNVVMVLSGMSNEEQLRDNISYMKDFLPLSEEQTERALRAGDMIRAEIKIPCTGCRYCVDTCPSKIAIPDYFNLYNNYMRFMGTQKWRLTEGARELSKKFGLPKDCVGCGACEGLCPQNIDIRAAISEVAKALE